MNKKCSSCGAENDLNAKFCRFCGNSNFLSEDSNDTTVLSQSDYPNMVGRAGSQPQPTGYQPPQPPVQPQHMGYQPQPTGYQPQQPMNPVSPAGTGYTAGNISAPEKKPKKKKTGLIIAGIVAGVILLFIIIAVIAGSGGSSYSGGYSDDSFYDDSYDNSDSSDDSVASIEYTKGHIDGDEYINEWADMRFLIPAGYKLADESVYKDIEADEKAECGVYLISENSAAVVYIVFEKLPYPSLISEDKYLNILSEKMTDESANTAEEETITWTFDTAHEKVFLGTYPYMCCKAMFSSAYNDVNVEFNVRKVDDVMISVVFMAADEDEITQNKNLLTCINGNEEF